MAEKSKYFIFRIDMHDRNPDSDPQDELEAAGVTVDRKFGCIPIDTDGHCLILRGVATGSVVTTLERDPHIQAFADLPVTAERGDSNDGKQ